MGRLQDVAGGSSEQPLAKPGVSVCAHDDHVGVAVPDLDAAIAFYERMR